MLPSDERDCGVPSRPARHGSSGLGSSVGERVDAKLVQDVAGLPEGLEGLLGQRAQSAFGAFMTRFGCSNNPADTAADSRPNVASNHAHRGMTIRLVGARYSADPCVAVRRPGAEQRGPARCSSPL